MIISIPIIISLSVLLVLALLTPLFSPFFRKVEEEEVSVEDKDLPPVSIVIAEHDCSYYLERTLPRYLSQDYSAGFQVIVVIDQGDTKSEDYLKLMSEQHPHLYYTKLPDSSRYVSRKKLGLTLGMRAAKNEWILIADITCRPSNNDWLHNVARHAEEGKNLVIALTPYEDDAPKYYRFEQLRTALYHLRSAQHGTAFSTNQSVLMLRRSEFFDQKGFYGNLEYARAEFDFLVNKFAKEGKTAIAIEPEARIEQYEPTEEEWTLRRMCSIDALKSMKRAAGFKSKYKTDLWLIHLFNILTLIAAATGGLFMLQSPFVVASGTYPEIQNILKTLNVTQYDGFALTSGAVLLWLINIIERCCIYSGPLEYFDSSLSSISAVIMEWGISLRNTILRIKYIFTDKTVFITHKL